MMMIEGEQQMAWNYLDLQLYIFAHDDAIIWGGSSLLIMTNIAAYIQLIYWVLKTAACQQINKNLAEVNRPGRAEGNE